MSKMIRKSAYYKKKICRLYLGYADKSSHEIQGRIDFVKPQTIEIINKLRESGIVIKVGNGPATGYKVLE